MPFPAVYGSEGVAVSNDNRRRMEISLEQTKALVKEALAGGNAEAALVSINDKAQILRETVDRGSVKAVPPDRYEVADSLQRWAHQLALNLAERDEDRLEEIAWQLRTSPILTMHGHCRHLVGPAMLDWANCNKRQGNQAKADMLFEAVIKDFQMLLDSEPAPTTECFTSLDSLKKALENHSKDHSKEIEAVKEKLNQWERLVSG
jgi:hypothetical protein